MKAQLAMVIDAGSCIDCKACMAACKVANKVPDDHWRNWIRSEDTEKLALERKPQTYQPGNCMHCDEPWCVAACPTGATYKNPADGTVVINHDLCIGCGQCVPACPYGARFRNPALKKADKCDFCAARRKDGLEPACVATCPTKARRFGDINDSGSDVHRLLKENTSTQVVNHKTNTRPNIYYLGTPGNADWPLEAKLPTSMALWKNLAGPAVNALVAVSGLGVLAMILKQIALPHDPPIDQNRDPINQEGGDHE